MSSLRPMEFTIAFDDFDVEVLPQQARFRGSEPFRKAVRRFYEAEFAPLGGSVSVEFVERSIRVFWMPTTANEDLFDSGIRALEQADAITALKYFGALVAVEPQNAAAHYNMGMIWSDIGELEKAKLHLVKASHLDPSNANALVALGVALYRSGDSAGAKRRLNKALEIEPSNGYAHRNLAAVLGNLGDGKGTIDHLRAAYRAIPEDAQTQFGLATALEQFGGPDELAEADELYIRLINHGGSSPLVEMAREARSKIAQKTMRRTGGDIRMDAVMYCLSALQSFDKMPSAEIRQIAFEIATKGRTGFDVNDPDSRYSLESFPGTFSGLQMMSLMYVAFQKIAPEQDIGFDLAAEYRMARQMHDGMA